MAAGAREKGIAGFTLGDFYFGGIGLGFGYSLCVVVADCDWLCAARTGMSRWIPVPVFPG
jgi:hypothetical protein